MWKEMRVRMEYDIGCYTAELLLIWYDGSEMLIKVVASIEQHRADSGYLGVNYDNLAVFVQKGAHSE